MKRMKNKKGFSLMETMMAITIFSFSVLGTLALMGQTMAFGKLSNNHLVAQNEARRVLEDIRKTADVYGLTMVAGMGSSGTVSNLPSGTYAITDLSGNPLTNAADPLPVRITVSWTEKAQTRNFIMEAKFTQR